MPELQKIVFTESFCQTVEAGGITKKQLAPLARQLQQTPKIGRDLGPGTEIAWVWDVTIPGHGEYLWYYIWDDVLEIVECVFILPKDCGGSFGDDVMLFARLAEFLMRLLLEGA